MFAAFYVVTVCGIAALSIVHRNELQAAAPGTGDLLGACEEARDTYRLTNREYEVLTYLAQGRSKRYIAEVLSLSENTVGKYTKSLYTKLDVHSVQELLTLLGVR